MAEIKVKSEKSLKHDTGTIKSSSALKIKQAPDAKNIGKKDAFILASKKIGLKAKGAGQELLKTATLTGAAKLYAKADDESTGTSKSANSAQDIIVGSGVKSTKNALTVLKKGGGDARNIAEQKGLGDKAFSPLKSRTAFSPFTSRRCAYDRAVSDKLSHSFSQSSAVAMRRTRQALAGIKVSPRLSRVKRAISKSPTGKAVYSAAKKGKTVTVKVSKAAVTGAKNVIKALLTVIRAMAGVMIPLIIIVAVVIIAISSSNGGGSGEQATVLTPLSATGTLSGTLIRIEISSADSLLLSFEVEDTSGSFFYTQGNTSGNGGAGVSLNGRITGNEITIEGVIDGEPVSLKGTNLESGSFSMYGFLGARAQAAMSGEWINPFGDRKYIITSLFGKRVHPITGELKNHDGYDMCSESGEGSPVYASATGKVSIAGVYEGYGNCVVLVHGDGLQSLYGHMNKITVNVGDEVHAGLQVGTEGNTGLSDGAHLHFEVRKDGTPVDSAEYYPLLYANASDIWY